jgi:hypothetical protein
MASIKREGCSLVDRNVPRKPRLVGVVKGHNINDITLPGSPAQCLPAGRQGRGASFVTIHKKVELVLIA